MTERRTASNLDIRDRRLQLAQPLFRPVTPVPRRSGPTVRSDPAICRSSCVHCRARALSRAHCVRVKVPGIVSLCSGRVAGRVARRGSAGVRGVCSACEVLLDVIHADHEQLHDKEQGAHLVGPVGAVHLDGVGHLALHVKLQLTAHDGVKGLEGEAAIGAGQGVIARHRVPIVAVDHDGRRDFELRQPYLELLVRHAAVFVHVKHFEERLDAVREVLRGVEVREGSEQRVYCIHHGRPLLVLGLGQRPALFFCIRSCREIVCQSRVP